jgi:hypothetical protein
MGEPGVPPCSPPGPCRSASERNEDDSAAPHTGEREPGDRLSSFPGGRTAPYWVPPGRAVRLLTPVDPARRQILCSANVPAGYKGVSARACTVLDSAGARRDVQQPPRLPRGGARQGGGRRGVRGRAPLSAERVLSGREPAPAGRRGRHPDRAGAGRSALRVRRLHRGVDVCAVLPRLLRLLELGARLPAHGRGANPRARPRNDPGGRAAPARHRASRGERRHDLLRVAEAAVRAAARDDRGRGAPLRGARGRRHADVEETTCMLRGDPACSLEIRFSDGLLPA